MAWWMWIVLGFVLLAAEALTPGGFFAFFFGLSALLVGLLGYIGLEGSTQTQWVLFSLFSVTSLLGLRRRMVGLFRTASEPPRAEYVGDVAVLVEDLEPGGVAKAELRGTSWNVRSRDRLRLPKGTRCTVESVEGLTLWIAGPHD